jgi:putative phosphoesterase
MDMKIAIISDIHGNRTALDAVLADLTAEAPDQIICLGDVVVTGPQPRAALARVRELGCPVVMGNADEWILAPTPFDIEDESDQILYDIESWGANRLSKEDKAFISSFQATNAVELGHGRSLLCFHGSPGSNTGLIEAATPDDELAEKLDGYEAAVFAGGHTHTPLLRRFRDSLILNPGSVGLPFVTRAGGERRNPAWAEYALLAEENGRFAITLRRVPYRLEALRAAVTESEMPHAAAYLADWIPGEEA